jgi:hypothetical protein
LGYPKVPGQKTRPPHDVDAALKEGGYQVETTFNPSAVQVVFDEQAHLLTGNGPRAIDAQAARLREILDGANQRAISSPGDALAPCWPPRHRRGSRAPAAPA